MSPFSFVCSASLLTCHPKLDLGPIVQRKNSLQEKMSPGLCRHDKI